MIDFFQPLPMQRHQHLFRCVRRVEGQFFFGRKRLDSLAQGKEQADAVHERRLAYGLDTEWAGRIVLIFQERDFQVIGHKSDVGHLVSRQGPAIIWPLAL